MKKNLDDLFNDVELACGDAVALAWDGCHKIYLAMDEKEVKKFHKYDYDFIIRGDAENLMAEFREIWDCSCNLKFVQSVKDGEFTTIIGQFDYEEYDEDDEDYDPYNTCDDMCKCEMPFLGYCSVCREEVTS